MEAAKYSRYHTFINPVVTNPKVKSSAPHIFSILTSIILIVFVIQPTYTTIQDLQQKIETKRTTYEKLEKKRANLKMAISNYEKLSPETKQRIEQALPNQADVAPLIANLHNARGIASSSSTIQLQQVTIIDKNASASAAKKKSNVEEVSYIYTTRGSYDELSETISRINRSSRVFVIDSMIMAKQPGNPLLLSITGRGFFLK